MKYSKASIHSKTHRIPEIRFEGQRLTSFTLAWLDARSVDKLRCLIRQQVLQCLVSLNLARVTLDFYGSVLSTGRFAG